MNSGPYYFSVSFTRGNASRNSFEGTWFFSHENSGTYNPPRAPGRGKTTTTPTNW